ncbi:putative membrane protein, DUF81 [Vibrio nigripulchritudo SOn1]|uniref:Probable membrane transporter protein n=1 Tax=Vibrio nigripulchritudo SOn1 TaxID=1238450 RepID=A0AAV2W0E3_9VIBR|nr:sulfite exporter TauE/SafE family protein [Vibrio nigripulchritudo]CCO50310.1 putative membrane protein, DUF81 [Vibrio nigripulchritudo SOn1]
MEFIQQFEWLSSPLTVLIFFFIVVLGSIIQFGFGMGFGIVATPFLVLIEPKLIPISTLYLGVILSLFAAVEDRKLINWADVRIYLSGRILGIFFAASVLVYITSEKGFSLFFGIIMAIALLMTISGWSIPFNRTSLFIAANLSGFMATITSVGGPPMALLYQSRSLKKSRATLSAYFSIGGVLSLIALYMVGWAGWNETLATLILFPPMLVGMLIARRLKGRLDSRFRVILLTLSAVTTCLLIYQGLRL